VLLNISDCHLKSLYLLLLLLQQTAANTMVENKTDLFSYSSWNSEI
jgi:hypothetical protein